MSLIEVLLVAVGLAMDAFAVCVASAACGRVPGRAATLRMAGTFGAFQAGMPVVGWLVGTSIAALIASFDHWVAFGLLAFVGGTEYPPQHFLPPEERPGIWVRPLDQGRARLLVERGMQPVFSPDGEWIAFFSEAGIQKIPVAGGDAVRGVSLDGFQRRFFAARFGHHVLQLKRDFFRFPGDCCSCSWISSNFQAWEKQRKPFSNGWK